MEKTYWIIQSISLLMQEHSQQPFSTVLAKLI